LHPLKRLNRVKKVIVVILNWNGGELTRRCLESLRQSDYANIECVVVDNGSTDHSPDDILAAFPETGMIRNATNLGFAEGCIQGMVWGGKRGADYFLMLNNDTRVDPAMVSRMVAAAAEHQDRAAIIPKIYWEHDPSRIWFAVGSANLWTGVFTNTAYNYVDDGRFDSRREMEFAVGCCVLMPKEIVEKVGGFDSSFFAYMEDVDWSLRCRGAGFTIVFCPAAKLWHAVSATGKRKPARIRYLMTRNHLWVMRRHASVAQLTCFLFLLPLRSMLRIAKCVLARDGESIKAEFQGVKDGLLKAGAPASSAGKLEHR
jgi:hypothetical protein